MLATKGDLHTLDRGRLIGGRSMKSITIDYSKRLAEEPGEGHNRWHEGIAPVIEAAPGEEIEIQTRDAFDGQISEVTTAEDLRRCDLMTSNFNRRPRFRGNDGNQCLLQPAI